MRKQWWLFALIVVLVAVVLFQDNADMRAMLSPDEKADVDDKSSALESIGLGEDDGEPLLVPQCLDGADNDNDGKIDYPLDCGCTSESDNDETGDCPVPPSVAPSGIDDGETCIPVYTPEDLDNVRNNLAGHYCQMNDIDLAQWNDGVFEPIGDEINYFTGTYDGRGFNIRTSHVSFYTPDRSLVGLFAGSSGVIQNVHLVNISADGRASVGSLAGFNLGMISRSSIDGGRVSGLYDVGGLVGINFGTIDNTYSNNEILGIFIGDPPVGGSGIGGLVGTNSYYYSQSVAIYNSSSSSNVNGIYSIDVGGLVGKTYGGIISRSFSTGGVSGVYTAGGLVGSIGYNSTILDSYSSSHVDGVSEVGGLVGGSGGSPIQTPAPHYVINSYSRGFVVGQDPEYTGGLVGRASYPPAEPFIVTNSYWNVQTSGQNVSAGGEGRTTAQMQQQSNYVGWDFVNVWRINPNQYPRLRWQN